MSAHFRSVDVCVLAGSILEFVCGTMEGTCQDSLVCANICNKTTSGADPEPQDRGCTSDINKIAIDINKKSW